MFGDDEAFCLLEEVPLRVAPEEAEHRQDPTAAHLRAALISAHAGGGGITVAWVRRRRNHPVEVLLGGDPALGIGDGDRVRPLYPPGSRGRRRSRQDVLDVLAGFPAWLRCGGVSDVLAMAAPDTRPPRRRGRSRITSPTWRGRRSPGW